ncbi:CBM_collapsed_G0027410.mRNA.1.CDS.1 [Saccharomyces cerevisiae]|nr:CBM_collapsed_G0027410.mRNA.1.CDS.1 [Saccharomyces cerevisiae]
MLTGISPDQVTRMINSGVPWYSSIKARPSPVLLIQGRYLHYYRNTPHTNRIWANGVRETCKCREQINKNNYFCK